MLVFVFWHGPAPGVSADDYEGRLARFHRSLRERSVPGLHGSESFACDRLPWSDRAGYEDWYVVADFAALGVLNDSAVDPHHRPAHDSVAGLAEWGTGGVYRLDDASSASSVELSGLLATDTATWFPKPPGMSHAQLGAQVRGVMDVAAAAGPTLWRRQLTLGPAPEFCLRSRGELALPAPLEATVVRLRPLGS